ncbi:MAG TPA: protein kinase [Solirubrobacterales bacterium]|nr:protein kinase [Solirubrobacterales bacterium]
MEGGLPPGERFGDFEILSVAGQGGMGVVYRARQVSLGRVVALKIISPQIASSEDFARRFAYESRLAASIDHPHVVSIFSSGQVGGRSFIAMQWIDGVSLHSMLANDQPLAPDRAVLIVSQIAGALDSAHAAGLIHRDVKPGNILVRSIGGRDHAYLTDFGIARRSGAEVTELTKTGETVGTIGYMAPEQIRGESPDGRADLYSLGCVLFECLTGHPPFERDSQPAMMFAHVSDERPRPSGLRPELGDRFDAVTVRAMALEPQDRYQTGTELADAVLAAGRGEAVGAAPTQAATAAGHPPPSGRESGPAASGSEAATRRVAGPRRSALLWIGAVLAVGAVALGAFAAAGGFSGEDNSSGSPSSTATAGDQTQGTTTGEQDGVAADDAAAEREVRAVLRGYETAYTDQDLGALAAIFTPDVTRRGLRAGGCSETGGIDEVLDTYSEQFASGTGAYTLTDLSSDAIEVSGDTATVHTGYAISPGGNGSVSFDLERQGREWLISRVDASC